MVTSSSLWLSPSGGLSLSPSDHRSPLSLALALSAFEDASTRRLPSFHPFGAPCGGGLGGCGGRGLERRRRPDLATTTTTTDQTFLSLEAVACVGREEEAKVLCVQWCLWYMYYVWEDGARRRQLCRPLSADLLRNNGRSRSLVLLLLS